MQSHPNEIGLIQQFWSRVVLRSKAIFFILCVLLIFWLPLIRGLIQLPWRRIKEQYYTWINAIKVCLEVLKTGEQQ